MTIVDLKQAKKQLNELLETALKGEEIIITDDFDAPLEDFEDYM